MIARTLQSAFKVRRDARLDNLDIGRQRVRRLGWTLARSHNLCTDCGVVAVWKIVWHLVPLPCVKLKLSSVIWVEAVFTFGLFAGCYGVGLLAEIS